MKQGRGVKRWSHKQIFGICYYEVIVLNSCELTLLVTAFANELAGILSDEELGLAAVVFSQLGDTLATIAVQKELCAKKQSD